MKTQPPEVCPHCQKPIRFIPLAEHLDVCPVRLYAVTGYDAPVVQAFSDLMRRAASERGQAVTP